jgi:parvulin-like peptidyl-prolyl isomerase
LATIGPHEIAVQDLLLYSRAKPNTLALLGSTEGRADVLRQTIENAIINLAAIEHAQLEPGYSDADLDEAVRALEAAQFNAGNITDAQVAAYYETHKDEMGIPPSVRIRDIFIPVPDDAEPDAREAARERAEALLQQAREGTPFRDLAAQHAHTEALRRVAGDEKYLPLTAFPYLAAATSEMQLGDLSDVIELPGGYQIFEFLGRRKGVLASLSQVEPQIRADLKAQAIARKTREFVAAYGNRLGVRILDPALAAAWPYAADADTAKIVDPSKPESTAQ